MLNRETCYRALLGRDVRFDGRFFTAVRTTGIYCRPICPARFPKPENCTFYATAAEAQQAGYRPCLRCRPEVAPNLAAWRGTGAVVERAMALIEAGALDSSSVDQLAGRLGLGERQLRRLFVQHVGVSPLAIAQARRVHLAKQLVTETALSLADVALASGFGSIRRFNHCFQQLYGQPPSLLRRPKSSADGNVFPSLDRAHQGTISLLLPYCAPYDWPGMVQFFAARALDGIEAVREHAYARTISVGTATGFVLVRPAAGRHCETALQATISLTSWAVLPQVVRQLKEMFDLHADPQVINRHLAHDPLLGQSVRMRPGLRVPGGWNGFEVGVRAILGQQITVAGGRRLGSRLVDHFGNPVSAHLDLPGDMPRLIRLFPAPERIAEADLTVLGMPRSRAQTINALARAALSDPLLFAASLPLEESVARLKRIPGIGDWTAQYIAMRALRHPDAFPAGDVALQNAAGKANGQKPSETKLRTQADAWQPWRAYAAQHLWSGPAPLGPLTDSLCTAKDLVAT
ncbi:MAG: 3-methyladenine DNA glycosylase 2 [Burkholderiales bacterium RIFCSPLOWO2_02_FULL_57_36]|nr:MAG: 3-methyladenine DNA glycosylase 2 [Burkholderiales bacterium RIFCSPLOWO2_02_FULL_57_36]